MSIDDFRLVRSASIHESPVEKIKNLKCTWGHSLNKNNRRETAKAVTFLHARASNGSSMQACSVP